MPPAETNPVGGVATRRPRKNILGRKDRSGFPRAPLEARTVPRPGLSPGPTMTLRQPAMHSITALLQASVALAARSAAAVSPGFRMASAMASSAFFMPPDDFAASAS